MSVNRISKTVLTKDLPDKLKRMRDVMDQINEQSFVQTWNIICTELAKFGDSTGDEALTCITTFTAQLAARFIAQSMSIVEADQTCYTLEELANSVTNGVHEILATKEIKRTENTIDVYGTLGIKKLE